MIAVDSGTVENVRVQSPLAAEVRLVEGGAGALWSGPLGASTNTWQLSVETRKAVTSSLRLSTKTLQLADAVVRAAVRATDLSEVWLAEQDGEIRLGLVVVSTTCNLIDVLLNDEAASGLLADADVTYAYERCRLPAELTRGSRLWSKGAT